MFGYDFYYLWSAGRLIHEGQNPYDLEMLDSLIRTLGWPEDQGIQGISHMPNSLWLYWLLALLPFKYSLAIWSFLSASASLFSAAIIGQTVLQRKNLNSVLVYFCTLTFLPAISNLLWGQINSLLILGIALYLFFYSNNKPILAGLGLSLILFKIHLLIPFVFGLAILNFKNKNNLWLVGFVGGFLAQMMFTLSIYPAALSDYTHFLKTQNVDFLKICGAMLSQTLKCNFGLGNYVSFILLVPAILLSIVYSVLSPKLDNYLLLIAFIPFSLLVSPYGWNHSFILLVPSWIVFNQYCFNYSDKLPKVLALVTMCGIPVVANSEWQRWWFLMPLVFFVAGLASTTASFKRLTQTQE